MQAVKTIAEKYQRQNNTNIPLCGAISDAPFMSHEKEASVEKFSNIVNRARVETHDERFVQSMVEYCCHKNEQTGGYRFRASTGMLTAIEMVLDEYKEYIDLVMSEMF